LQAQLLDVPPFQQELEPAVAVESSHRALVHPAAQSQDARSPARAHRDTATFEFLRCMGCKAVAFLSRVDQMITAYQIR
jgi:hypothetical protein